MIFLQSITVPRICVVNYRSNMSVPVLFPFYVSTRYELPFAKNDTNSNTFEIPKYILILREVIVEELTLLLYK